MKEELINIVSKAYSTLFSRANPVTVRLAQSAVPIYQVRTKYGLLKLSCPNPVTLWRGKTFFTKEPDMLEWIDTFNEGDVFFDIGANVGLYSLYAGLKGIKVFSFEPESGSFSILNRNIYLNDLTKRVTAFNLALSDRTCFDYLYLSEMMAGWACHNFAEAKDFRDNSFDAKYAQGVMSFTLDELLAHKPFTTPTHIKIDVDGLEDKIIAGSSTTLRSPELRSLMIELNEALSRDIEIIRTLEAVGFQVVSKYHAPMQEQTEFRSVYNFLFRKTPAG